MKNWSAQDHRFMALALQLAQKAEFSARPNPMVGCVIVKNGQIIGQGWHQNFGEEHAEINALNQAGDKAKGATCYVTLEPCAHVGKTGACAVALVEAGVNLVIAAMKDPNPAVCGNGFKLLEDVGISTSVGLLENQARQINRGFISRFERKRPWVTVKLAMSLDGRTALENGTSQWITGAESRADVQKLRAKQDAIITGSGTQSTDNPSLTARIDFDADDNVSEKSFRQPLRVLLDRNAKANLSDKFFAIDQRQTNHKNVWWVSQSGLAQEKLNGSPAKNIRLIESLGLEAILLELSTDEVNHVLVEAGHQLAGQFLKQGLVDELVIYMAPKLMGSNALGLFQLDVGKMDECPELELISLRQFGNDIRLVYQPKITKAQTIKRP